MATKGSVRRRVAKALRKYVRGNAARFHRYMVVGEKTRHFNSLTSASAYAKRSSAFMNMPVDVVEFLADGSSRIVKTVSSRSNPPRVKGRKTKGGRAVTLRNFTGTIVKKSDGTVQIVGRGRRK